MTKLILIEATEREEGRVSVRERGRGGGDEKQERLKERVGRW